MTTVTVRARGTLEAFQWNGEEVEGFERICVGCGPTGIPFWNIVAVNIDDAHTFGVPGDWVITAAHGGSWIWHQHDFENAYEVIR